MITFIFYLQSIDLTCDVYWKALNAISHSLDLLFSEFVFNRL